MKTKRTTRKPKTIVNWNWSDIEQIQQRIQNEIQTTNNNTK